MRLIDADAMIDRLKAWDTKDKTDKALYNFTLNRINEQATIQPEPHWIPVTEDTLPEKNRVVIVCGDKGTWDVGRYRGYSEINENINLWNWKNKTLKRVYWWMYKEDALPEPYKGVME